MLTIEIMLNKTLKKPTMFLASCWIAIIRSIDFRRTALVSFIVAFLCSKSFSFWVRSMTWFWADCCWSFVLISCSWSFFIAVRVMRSLCSRPFRIFMKLGSFALRGALPFPSVPPQMNSILPLARRVPWYPFARSQHGLATQWLLNQPYEQNYDLKRSLWYRLFHLRYFEH
jgi:hypothetical protein